MDAETPKTKKRDLLQRWRDLQLEKFEEFRRSADREHVRREGLSLLGRTSKPTSQELFELVRQMGARADAAAWMKFMGLCKEVGARWGLDARTAMMAGLVRGYRPDLPREKPFDLAATKARLVIATDIEADLRSPFFTNLLTAAAELGLTVQTRTGRFPPSRAAFRLRGDGVVTGTLPWWEWINLADAQRPPLQTAFRVRLEFPPRFPPELACEWAREAVQAQNELARMLGYRVPQRLRQESVAQRD